MSRDRIILILSVLGILFALWRLMPERQNGQSHRRDLANELAQWIAREAAKGAKGPLLIFAPEPSSDDPFPNALLQRAERHFAKAGFTPITTISVPYEENMESTGEPISRNRFQQLADQYPQCTAILSLIGLPRFTEANPPNLTYPKRIFVASMTTLPGLDDIPSGIVDFVVTTRNYNTGTTPDPALGKLGEDFVLKLWHTD